MKEFDQGKSTEQISREHALSKATFYKWRQRYGGLEANELKRLKELEEENSKQTNVCQFSFGPGGSKMCY